MGKSNIVHIFKDDLDYSNEENCEEFWKLIYQKAFPDFVDWRKVEDLKLQKLGIDRALLLSNGKYITIDEKKRKLSWGDILLEFISVDINNSPGWVEKNLFIDYIAYAFIESQTVYFFPWKYLKKAWLLHKNSWFTLYETIVAKNKGYSTHSLAIPINVLLEIIPTTLIVKL